MMVQLEIDGITIDIEKKKVKNMRLVVSSATGKVRVSAPLCMSEEHIRNFIVSKIDWIKKHQERFSEKIIQPKQVFSNDEVHYFQGVGYILRIIEHNKAPKIILTTENSNIITESTENIQIDTKKFLNLYVKPNTSAEICQLIINKWYRIQLEKIIKPLIEKWEAIIGVKSNEFRIKQMKTRWGTCNIQAKRIWLSLELAKKSVNCLEYIIAHELVHLLERLHNARFVGFMNKFMPNWKIYKKELNEL